MAFFRLLLLLPTLPSNVLLYRERWHDHRDDDDDGSYTALSFRQKLVQLVQQWMDAPPRKDGRRSLCLGIEGTVL